MFALVLNIPLLPKSIVVKVLADAQHQKPMVQGVLPDSNVILVTPVALVKPDVPIDVQPEPMVMVALAPKRV